ncbi:hypothetical protein DSM112329_03923 [Paraconexibacter sp. AEG42_29]|uniref:Regulator of SigK n=1 Tax=Paraconexibacter sp. AEG42_29 TaxID=2997339 RepID=A0AAU7AZ95_9ACTN
MSLPDCERGLDAGAYLLSALPPEDHASFIAHLRSCDCCQREVEDLQLVVDTLPMAAPQFAPPAALKDRIMRVVDAEAELLRAAGPEADRVPVRAEAARERRLWRWGSGLSVRPALAGGIASVLLAVGVAGGVVFSDSDGGSAGRTLAAQVPGSPGATVKVSLKNDRATLHVANLPSAPAGQVYQVWFTRKGSTTPEPTHTLFSVRKNDGRSTVPIEESVEGVGQILVTAEPDGGSEQPSADPVISAQLS